MKIQTVRIKNFRALADVTIEFDSVTTFIGPNGTGKSTVLRALDWFFNGKNGQLTEKDCYFGSTNKEIEVQVTFDDLTDRDRSELGKYAPAGSETFTAWKRWDPDGSETLSANSKSFALFNEIREQNSAADKKLVYNRIREEVPTLNLPTWTNTEASMQALTSWEASNTGLLVEAPESLQTNFFGFNSGGKMSGLFDFVLVTADLRATEESVDGKTSIIGRILERSIDRSAADNEIAQIVEDARIKQQQVYDSKFTDQLESMKQQLNDVVKSYSPDRSVNVTPAEVELKAPRTSFNLTIQDGDNETQIERQGHGFQRTLLISALQLLAQSGAASDEGYFCLAIEEPELFQHPIQAQAFAKVLRALADNQEKRMQICYATHSPYFLEVKHFDQVRRLSKSPDETSGTIVTATKVSEVINRLEGVIKEETVLAQLGKVITNDLNVALFANRVLLVEGTTDVAVFYGIGDRGHPGGLELEGISIVSARGKDSIPLAHAILRNMGIPVYALIDADKGFEKRAKINGKNDEQILQELNSHVKSNQSIFRYFGITSLDFPDSVVHPELAIFEDHLEAFLDQNWPEWGVACKQIEIATGIKLSKNHDAYRNATLFAEGDVPQMLEQILEKVRNS